VVNPQSAIRNPQSAIRNPQSAIRNPTSNIRHPTSDIRHPNSFTPSPMTLFQPSGKDVALPSRASTIAMWLFLASLTMLFGASMLGYVLIRVVFAPPENAETLRSVHMPVIFVVSTALVLAGSWTVQRAVGAIRRERKDELLRWLLITAGVAIAFCFLQIPGLYWVFEQHVPRTQQGANLARLLFCLIILHALHVVGGIVYLFVVLSRAGRGVYDHEHYVGVKHAALYWHFLDVVWLVMYGMMVVLG
jgi:heme/copper-type cytochrome/quinol oxidase subunit 3